MEIGGTLPQQISSCLEELDTLMTVNSPIVSSMVVAVKRFISSSKGDIVEMIMNIMSIRDIKTLSMETKLSKLGMDSLMIVEFSLSTRACIQLGADTYRTSINDTESIEDIVEVKTVKKLMELLTCCDIGGRREAKSRENYKT